VFDLAGVVQCMLNIPVQSHRNRLNEIPEASCNWGRATLGRLGYTYSIFSLDYFATTVRYDLDLFGGFCQLVKFYFLASVESYTGTKRIGTSGGRRVDDLPADEGARYVRLLSL
jgi:hypothetical protein